MKQPPVNSSVCYCINLRRAAQSLTEYYDAALKKYGISINQYSIMQNLRENQPCSTTKLAEIIRLDRTTLVRNLKILLEKGLIKDEKESGRRARRLSVTERGSELLDAAAVSWKKAQEDLEQFIGKEETLTIMKALLRIEQFNARIEQFNAENFNDE